MSRFITSVICVVLIVAALPLEGISQGGERVYAAQIGAKQESPDAVYQSDTSPYDGTYSGTFNYEYREVHWNEDYPLKSDEMYVYRPWVPASFALTLTFETHRPQTEQSARLFGQWLLDITNVIVSDEDFDTGSGGVTPSKGSGAFLPLDAFTATAGISGVEKPNIVYITFPNGAYLQAGSSDLQASTEDKLKVDFGEWTLSGSSWSVHGITTVPLSHGKVKNLEGLPWYEINSKSWSLKKVPGLAGGKAGEARIAYISGDLYVWNELAGEWQKNDLDILKSNTRIRTGENGRVILEYGDDYEFTVAPNTTVDVVDLSGAIDLLLGKIRASVQELGKRFEVKTPSVAVAVRGTEFTVDVAADGTTTVMVLAGAVAVTDITSGKSITLVMGQSVTIPKTASGLNQEDMLRKVTYVPPETLDRWWEKEPASVGGQPAAQSPAVNGKGGLVIGKFEITSSGTRFTPAGFIFAFTAIAAIFFLVMGQVFAFRLRRVSKRK